MNLRYTDIGHGVGALLWWLDDKGRLKSLRSTGKEFHHDIATHIDMDARWRGRIEPSSGRTTLMPPLSIYTRKPEAIVVPPDLLRRLLRRGAKGFYIDTSLGLMRMHGEYVRRECHAAKSGRKPEGAMRILAGRRCGPATPTRPGIPRHRRHRALLALSFVKDGKEQK
jgi:hypothetical protein